VPYIPPFACADRARQYSADCVANTIIEVRRAFADGLAAAGRTVIKGVVKA